jgi:putative membrane protein
VSERPTAAPRAGAGDAPDLRGVQALNLAVFALALAHALATWPPGAVLALFCGGAVTAVVAEAGVTSLGLLDHRLCPQVAGVPVTVVLAWPGLVYVALRSARALVTDPLAAVALAAGLAATADALIEPRMVARGAWAYPPSPLSRPRLWGVPWWNAVGWLVIVALTASYPLAVR